MVHTRQHPDEGQLEKLSEGGGGKTEAQGEGPMAKKAKTGGVLEGANRELEEGIEKTYSKEKKRLEETGDTEEGVEEPGEEGEEYEPSQEEEGEAQREKAGEATEVEKGEAEGEKEEGEEMISGGKAKGGRKGASSKAPTKGAQGLKVGSPAPQFSLQDQDGNTVALKEFKGKPVALYFYNKDDTPVVNKGGQAFAKAFAEMKKMGCALLFIGPDSVQSHKKFQEKAKLPFPLLSDPKKEVAKAYNNLRGRNVMRTTVLIGPNGKVLKADVDIPEEAVEKNPFDAIKFLKSEMTA